MTVKLSGSVEYYTRIRTGSYSLDWALAGGPKGVLIPGYPLRTISILSGKMMSGKSTFAVWLAGRIAEGGKIAGAYIEEYDKDMLITLLEEAEYSGEMHLIDGDTDENYVDEMDKCMMDEAYAVGIWDSLGAILTISEAKGKSGEANMGRRALLVSKLLRRARKDIRNREKPFSLICTNHIHPNIGNPGNSLSGGVTQNFMSGNILELASYHDQEHFFEDGSFIIGGYCRKVKFGPSYRRFQVFNLAGYGPHLGMSAVVDCIAEGLATKERTIKLGDKSFGYMKDLIKEAKKGNLDTFVPFREKLTKLESKEVISEEPKKKGKKK